MKNIHLNLAFPPTVNSYYTKTRRGIFISKKGREFRDMCAEQCNEQNAYGLLLSHPLQLDVILFPPDRRKRDLDNYMKALLDALTTSKVWEDDSLVDGLTVRRGVITPRGMVSLRISAHDEFIIPNVPTIWDHID